MTHIKIIIPTWNESKNIVECLNRIHKVMATMNLSYEVIVVDDNSPDGTAHLAIEYGKNKGNVKVLIRENRSGYGSAFRDGLSYAVRDPNTTYIVTMDADLSHQPEDLPRLLSSAMSENVDVVQGSRYVSGGAIKGRRWHRNLMSLIANFLVKVLFRTGLRENTTSFRVFSLKAANLIANETKSNGYEWLVEALLIAKKKELRVIEVPITFIDRKRGKSKLRGRDIAKWFWFIINYWLRSRHEWG